MKCSGLFHYNNPALRRRYQINESPLRDFKLIYQGYRIYCHLLGPTFHYTRGILFITLRKSYYSK